MLKLIRPLFDFVSSTYGFLAKMFYPIFSSFPLRITIMITNKCNLHCSFCYVKESLNKPSPVILSLEEWKKVIDSVPFLTSLSFSGGEVFLAPHFLELLDYIGKKRHLFSVVTNGTMLNQKVIEKIISSRLTYLMLSLDGFKEIHNQMRGAEAFDKACANIKELIRQKGKNTFPIISVKTVISPDNYHQLFDFTRFVNEELGIGSIHYSFLVQNQAQNTFVISDDQQNDIFLSGNTYQYPPHAVEPIIAQIEAIKKYSSANDFSAYFSTKDSSSDFLRRYLSNPRSFNVKKCDNPWNEFTIYPDGTLTSCITSYIGNIRTLNYNVKKVLSSPKYKQFLRHLKKRFPNSAPCQGCIFKKHEEIN